VGGALPPRDAETLSHGARHMPITLGQFRVGLHHLQLCRVVSKLATGLLDRLSRQRHHLIVRPLERPLAVVGGGRRRSRRPRNRSSPN
jgi:hypothetical protein